MKLNDFKKLEESIQEQDFNKSFKNINKVMFFLSIFGHLASIFLAYFLVSKILSGAITDNPFLVSIASIILLGGLELLKREIFDKFSLQQIKHKSFTNSDVLPLFLVSLVIVSISFYSSVKGAKEFSNKSKQIDTQEQAMSRKYAAHLDAKRRSAIAQMGYSMTQQREAKTVYEAVRVSYSRSKVYLTYRDKFYTVKVHHPAAADKMSKEVTKVEQVLDELGAEKVETAQGIIYRIAKR